MRPLTLLLVITTLAIAAAPAHTAECRLTPKEVVTKFLTEFYLEKRVRQAFETWVEPGYSIKRIIADGNLVAVHSHDGMF
jgi:hypothetical protein